LLTGDDLSIQLFIAGTAIAIMGIAVTQAGWTHKGFVWSLFVVALGLGFCALYWKQIREANPEVGAFASGIAGNSISWFTLLLVGFGLVFFLDLLARTGWLAERKSGREIEKKNIEPEIKSTDPAKEKQAPKEKIFIDVAPVSGKIINVAEGNGYSAVMLVDDDRIMVSAVCYGDTMKRSAGMRRGQAITVEGEIDIIDNLRVRLERCDITAS
jgi:hypothetical protein